MLYNLINEIEKLILYSWGVRGLTYFDPTFYRRDSYISILMSGLHRVYGRGLDAVTHLAGLGVEKVGNGVLGINTKKTWYIDLYHVFLVYRIVYVFVCKDF